MINNVVDKWKQTGLLDNVSHEQANTIASTLDNLMIDVIAGNKPYLAIEEEIIRLRKNGMFVADKKVQKSS